MAGLTEYGFEKKTLSEIKREIEDKYKGIFGPQINLNAPSVFSQLVGTESERESLIWDLLEEIYNSQSPSSAFGVLLDKVVAVTGVTRLTALASVQKDQHLFGDVGTVIPAGTQLSVLGAASSQFLTDSPVTLIAGQDEIQKIEFNAVPTSGNFRLSFRGEQSALIQFNATAAQIQDILLEMSLILNGLTVAGSFAAGFTITFGGDNGKINHPLLVVVDNLLKDVAVNPVTTTVTELTAGIAQGKTDMTAVATGPTSAPAYALTVIDTPVVGLSRVLNPEAAIIGRNVEKDADLRQRRKTSLQRSGSATIEAMESKLKELIGVDEAIIFENDTLVVDGMGLPAKSFRAYVQGGDDADIAQSIWKNKPGGIQSDGTISVVTQDSNGRDHTIKFSRPDVIQIYLKLMVEKTADYPPNGDQTMIDRVFDYINSLPTGQDVIVYPKIIALFNDIPGIEDIQVGIGTAPNPTVGAATKVVIDAQEIARQADKTQTTVGNL